jgi:two-component system NtrC family response regulator
VTAAKLLIVEDDPGLRSQLRWCFDNYEVVFAEDREAALAQVRRHEPAVILQDLGLPPDPDGVEEGMATVSDILSLASESKIIVVTGNGDEQAAVRAIGLGAYDFYSKPVETDTLKLIVSRAFHVARLERENRRLLANSGQPLDGLITASHNMLRACSLLERVAGTDATTLLQGETGTGKEVMAQGLHRLSPRCEGRFVAINCAAIPENLLESELFGYERGAYTGAHKQTKGKLELAHGGTLFLDEIGDMPVSLQSKLLRFLQSRTLERVGGREEIPVDVRVVCATHRDLSELIESGEFREDLYYRISEVTVGIPPLRERGEDAVLLARHFLHRSAARHGRPVKDFTDDALAAIRGYRWPGNVRELENKVNSAVILADGKLVGKDELGLSGAADAMSVLNLREARDNAEREAIDRAFVIADSNISRTAELLGVSRPTLYSLLKKHGIRH